MGFTEEVAFEQDLKGYRGVSQEAFVGRRTWPELVLLGLRKQTGQHIWVSATIHQKAQGSWEA